MWAAARYPNWMRISAIAAAALLAGCGGGSGSVTVPRVNQAPNFTSATTTGAVENVTGAIYTAAATDPEGSAVTYSISGGADASAFAVSGNQLAFVNPPNYDLPGDADGNNVYLVQLRASDGAASQTLDLQVTVTNSKEGIAVKRVATGFVDPVAIAAIPGDTRLFVAERGGKIWMLDTATGAKTLFQTLSVSTAGERGLHAIAVSPNYATNGLYFVLRDDSLLVAAYGCTRSGTFGLPECNQIVTYLASVHDQPNDFGAFMA